MFNYNFVFLLIFLAKNIICAPFHIDAPIVAVSNGSLEAIGIANKIYQHFESVNKNDIFNEVTGKSMSEALIFASTNPRYDDRLFIELPVKYMKIPSSEHGENLMRTC
jgi:hypothetical protein